MNYYVIRFRHAGAGRADVELVDLNGIRLAVAHLDEEWLRAFLTDPNNRTDVTLYSE